MRSPSGRPIKLADIAAEAGVSVSTVSRVLNRPGMLPAATEETVRQIAVRLGYGGNRAARALSTGRSDLVLIVVPDIANSFFPRLVRAAQRALIAADLYGVLVDTADSPSTEARLIGEVGRNTRGVINMSSRLQDDELVDLAARFPTVLVNREVGGLPSIVLDAESGVRAGLQQLLDLGHRAFAYVGGPEVSWSARRREQAVRDVLDGIPGIRLTVINPSGSTFDDGMAATDAVLASGATAVQVFDDVMAQGLIHGLLQRRVGVPDTISVVGCDGTLSPGIRGAFATVTLDYEHAGAWAARTLNSICDGHTVPVATAIRGEFLAGDSIGPAPAGQGKMT